MEVNSYKMLFVLFLIRWSSILITAAVAIASAHRSPLHQRRVDNLCRSCGWSSMTTGQSRIFNGKNAKQGQFPWRVSLFIGQIGQTEGLGCSGTIIDRNWVLTAAHCFKNVKGLPPSKYFVQIEYGNITVPSKTPLAWNVPATEIYIHRHYNNVAPEFAFVNDIALIRISRGFIFNENVRPVCLPYKFVEAKYTGYATYGSGWGAWKGHKGSYESPHVLQWSKFYMHDYNDCSNLARTLGWPYRVNQTQMCIKSDNSDVCEGDSGGSIDTFDTRRRFYALGVQSARTGKCNHRNNVSILTRVDRYLQWIEDTTGLKFCTE